MKTYKIDKYELYVYKENIICTCMWGSLYPNNYKQGEKICKHIKKLMKNVNKSKKM